MLIKKIYDGEIPENKIMNEYTTTTSDTYSCDYINNNAGNPYPVGSVYISVLSTNPHDLFGGTWEQLPDRFLLGAGSTYTNGNTGGEASVTLTSSQIPAHKHGFTTGGAGGHNHSISGIASRQSGSWNGVVASANTSDRNWSTVSWVNDHTHSGTTNDNSGGGGSHNNMPPYLVVYMWKRTA